VKTSTTARRARSPAEDPSAPSRARAEALRRALLAWYAVEKRDLPWRRTSDPYAIWLSEVMLQQTRVETVVPYWERFLAAYPDVVALADAPLEDVLARWSGLGYYRRARMLHATALQVRDAHGGAFPDSVEGLRTLRGVGPYTAGAVASIAFGRPAALVDGNVARVLARVFAMEEDVRGGAGLARVWAIAEALVPEEGAGTFNQALMELGATVCTPRAPRCLLCPARDVCEGRARGLEAKLPVLAPKRRPELERRVAVVVTHGDGVVLARRGPHGTFAAMWEPPGLVVAGDAGDAGALAAHAATLGAALGVPRVASAFAHAGRVVHVLSHRRLEVDVLALELARAPRRLRPPDGYGEARLVARGGLGALGVPTYARKLLARARFA